MLANRSRPNLIRSARSDLPSPTPLPGSPRPHHLSPPIFITITISALLGIATGRSTKLCISKMANIRYVSDPKAKPKGGPGAGAAPAAAATTTATMFTITSTDGAGAHSRQSSAEPSHGGANAEHPNDGSGDHRPAKKRKVLSCFPCRDRKMKCDRGYPICGRCEKTGRNGQCTYDPRLLNDAHAATANSMRHVSAASGFSGYAMSSSMSVAAAEGLVHRAIGAKVPDRRLESLAHAGDVPRLVSPFEPVLRSGAYSEKGEGRLIEDMMFRGKGFKSMFTGSTSVFAIISKVSLTDDAWCSCSNIISVPRAQGLHI